MTCSVMDLKTGDVLDAEGFFQLTVHPCHLKKDRYGSGGGSTFSNLNDQLCSSTTMGYRPKDVENAPIHTNCCSAVSTQGKKVHKQTHRTTIAP